MQKPLWSHILGGCCAYLIMGFARLLTGVRAYWLPHNPAAKKAPPPQRIYIANHSSHGDFVLLWTCLPRKWRKLTRPVAGADYWHNNSIRRFISDHVFHAVLVTRHREKPEDNPLAAVEQALQQGDSLIFFPEGTRNLTDATLLPFKSGIYHLLKAHPSIECIPVWLDNLNRVMPKGRVLPLPLLCTVHFGPAVFLEAEEDKTTFLKRLETALLALQPANR